MKTCVKGKPIQMVLPRCTKVFPFLSQFFCRAFPNIFPICCRCLATCHAHCCNMLCTRQLSETKTIAVQHQPHWLAGARQSINGTMAYELQAEHFGNSKEIRSKDDWKADNFPYGRCRPPNVSFFPDIHSLFVASNLRACRSILPFLSATTYQPVGRHGW